MKSPEAVLRSALVGNATVAALIGTKVYPVLAPASAPLPLVTWRRAGISRSQTLSAPMGVPQVSVEYQIYAGTYEAARDIADAMRVVLDGYRGVVDNTTVRQTSLENEVDEFVQLQGSDLPAVYQITQTYDVWWQET